ncbi:hypothetical protein [Kineosporia sp. NBRC 101731]|uniref:type IV toxin-antitoxin system AbiEi family antitoxin domain-containing protein n=1 Tax=Kineosporia sp. NBRC 101731 TaxID=3032199 RepID=UPI0024A3A317|nr:hypothetical protein [Kineosporia sp. NBRC 101731]GLY30073.1 hypothetical protein Kisp02_34380 [Kineosporia sp. NBRC 101731]
MSDERDELWRVAAGQRGYFTAAQAITVDYSHQAQYFHAQRGNWIRVGRALYRLREFDDLPAEPGDHLVRWFLWSKERAVVSHATALSVHDLGIANPDRIHLTVPPGFRQKDAALILHRGELESGQVQQHNGFLVTTPMRAVAETAAAGADQDVIDSAVAELLDRGLATRRQLLKEASELGPASELAVQRAFS